MQTGRAPNLAQLELKKNNEGKTKPIFLLLTFRMGNSWGIAQINQVERTDESCSIVFSAALEATAQTVTFLLHMRE